MVGLHPQRQANSQREKCGERSPTAWCLSSARSAVHMGSGTGRGERAEVRPVYALRCRSLGVAALRASPILPPLSST